MSMDAVEFVNKIKTRQSEFLRVIPNLKLDKNGSIFLCPATITDDLCGVYSDKR